MAQYGTEDLIVREAMEGHAADAQNAFDLRSRLQEATQTAHTTACHLRFLVAACTTQGAPCFQLRTQSLAVGMQQLSECARELRDQLDAFPMLDDRHASREIEKCSELARHAAGLMQLIADATSEQWLGELELDIDDFMGSLQDLADRMKRIEACLENVQRRQGG